MREWIKLIESQLFEFDNVEQNPAFEDDPERDSVFQMYKSSDEFTKAYIESMMFTEAHSDNPDLEHATIQDFAMETMQTILNDCRVFQTQVEAAGINLDHASVEGHNDYSSLELAGHDFWLTRNHHGAGFWDGDWNEPDDAELTKIAHTFKSLDVYAGDDGKVYFH